MQSPGPQAHLPSKAVFNEVTLCLGLPSTAGLVLLRGHTEHGAAALAGCGAQAGNHAGGVTPSQEGGERDPDSRAAGFSLQMLTRSAEAGAGPWGLDGAGTGASVSPVWSF